MYKRINKIIVAIFLILMSLVCKMCCPKVVPKVKTGTNIFLREYRNFKILDLRYSPTSIFMLSFKHRNRIYNVSRRILIDAGIRNNILIRDSSENKSLDA